jgi:hypothetical protein
VVCADQKRQFLPTSEGNNKLAKTNKSITNTPAHAAEFLRHNGMNQDHINRIMRGFEALVEIGYLIPQLDADGKPMMRRGQPVYTRTKDPT